MKTIMIGRGFFAILALMAVFSLQACAQPAAAPTPAPDVFEPAPVIEVQNATIAVYNYQDEKAFSDIVKRINVTLHSAGQNVEFEVRHMQYVEGSNSAILDAVRKELAAGKPTADAYPFNFLEARELKNAALLMDVTGLILQNAPALCSKYSLLFPEKMYGVPLGIYSKPMWNKTALILRSDLVPAGSGITTTESLFAFLDETVVTPKKPYSIVANPNELVLQWALEQGYYNLRSFGVDGYLIAAINDPAFTPVTIESIPGFGEFLLRLNQYYRNQSLSFPNNLGRGQESIGYVKGFSGYYATNAYGIISAAEGDFTALLLSPELPSYFHEPFYANELVIPAAGTEEKAAQVIRFVDWLYASQDNFDSIVYGVQGVDFTGADGRYSPMVNGKPVKQMKNLFFAWPAAHYLYNFDYTRLSQDAPSNTKELIADGLRQNRRFPLAAHFAKDRETIDSIFETTAEMTAVITQRNDILNSIMFDDPARLTKDSLDFNLDRLAKLKNAWLIEQYQGIMKKIIEKQ